MECEHPPDEDPPVAALPDTLPATLTTIQYLPDSLLLTILGDLSASDVLRCAQVCRCWQAVAADESLWRGLVYSQWGVGGKISPGQSSWRGEYKRMYYHAPLVWSETLTEHFDEVLHVSFSHNGLWFATTSKDCSAKVWQVGYPTKLKYNYNFREEYMWDFTQFSCFNELDTMLLVSSVKATEIDRKGFVAVLSITNNFQLLRVVTMNPSQLFGNWLNMSTFLGGSLEISLDRFATSVQIQAFEVRPTSTNVKDGPQTLLANEASGLALFTFCSETASLIKFLTVVNVPCPGISPIQETEHESYSPQERDIVSHQHPHTPLASHSGQGEQLCNNIAIHENGHPLCMNSMVDSDMEDDSGELARKTKKVIQSSKRSGNSSNPLKLRNLIYVTGEFAVALHQLGFKDISPTIVSDIEDERTLESAETDFNSIPCHMVVNYSTQNIQMRRIRKPDMSDHMIDLSGHVTGLCVSQDERYLFVNCRPWLGPVDRSDPWATPELSPEIEVRVIDLQNMCDTGIRYKGHKGFSQSTMCCFVFLDSSENYIGSGSEDMKGYIWDRHYRCCLGTFSHGPGVVNAVGFNPTDQEYLVTVSDDHTIKIWRSRNRLHHLRTDSQQLER